MPNVKKGPEPETSTERAKSLNDSFLGIPGYADDTMLSVVRYFSKVQETLRKCDFDEFLIELRAVEEASKDATQTPAARVEKVKEHRERARSKVQEFPELAAEFDTFAMNSKRLRRQQKEAEETAKAAGSQQ